MFIKHAYTHSYLHAYSFTYIILLDMWGFFLVNLSMCCHLLHFWKGAITCVKMFSCFFHSSFISKEDTVLELRAHSVV